MSREGRPAAPARHRRRARRARRCRRATGHRARRSRCRHRAPLAKPTTNAVRAGRCCRRCRARRLVRPMDVAGGHHPPTCDSNGSPTPSASRKCRPSRLTVRTSRSWRGSMAGARSGSAGSRAAIPFRSRSMTTITTHPRWTPDSSAIVYFIPPRRRRGRGGSLGDPRAQRRAAPPRRIVYRGGCES